jgi:hypothetical protein
LHINVTIFLLDARKHHEDETNLLIFPDRLISILRTLKLWHVSNAYKEHKRETLGMAYIAYIEAATLCIFLTFFFLFSFLSGQELYLHEGMNNLHGMKL